MSERDMWAAVAETAILDAAKMIRAARSGKRSIHIDSSTERLVGTVDQEIAAARRYFDSPDWREVSSLAGVNLGCEDVMRIISKPGWLPHRAQPGRQKEAAA